MVFGIEVLKAYGGGNGYSGPRHGMSFKLFIESSGEFLEVVSWGN
jgi:hypothetical protein